MIGTLWVKSDSEIPCGQIDFPFISGVGVWCPEAQAKAPVLTMVDMVTGRSPDIFMVRSRAENARPRHDTAPAMRQLAESFASFRHPRSSINPAEHQSVCGVERAHQSMPSAARALRTDIRARTGEGIPLGSHSFRGC